MNEPRKNLSWAEKVANDKAWFKDWVQYLTGNTNLRGKKGKRNTQERKNFAQLYGVYNSQFPSEWFKEITNPFSSKNEEYKAYPAKVRPINYLRTNIDLLLGEFLQRPIKFTVSAENSYSRYLDGLNNTVTGALQQYAEEIMQGNEQAVPPDIAQLEHTYKMSFKDKLAVRAQRKVKEIVKQYHIKRELVKCKKDYLVAGEAYTYKGILPNGKFMYHRISPEMIDHDKSGINSMVNKSNWVVVKYQLTPAEITDMFWDSLEDKDYKIIDDAAGIANLADASSFSKWINNDSQGKANVYHVQWRARRKVLQISGIDEETGQPYEFEADEDYKRAENEQQTHYWKSEIYEAWEIEDKIVVGARNLPYQEDLSYNGRVYSDTHSSSLSVMEMGIPIQILLMVVHYKIELTIAQSKGKIILLDKNTISRKDGWTEERFFYYAESKGWALIDRSQAKVDRTMNQYQVMDLTMYERIAQLIEVATYLKQSWDDLIGITRPRKGATAASDAVGVQQQGLMQSNIITDMIFYTFEELIEDDLNGLAELSRVADAMGIPAESWMLNDFDRELAAIDPLEASLEKLNLYMEYNTEELAKLNMARQLATQMLQNQTALSTVMEVLYSESSSELRARVLEIEDQLIARQQQAAQSDKEAEQMLVELEKERDQFKHILDMEFMNAEYDRKEDLKEIEGAFNTFTFQDGDSNDNGVPDAAEIMKIIEKKEDNREKRNLKLQEMKMKNEQHQRELKEKAETRKSNERIARDKAAADKVKARAAAKRKAN